MSNVKLYTVKEAAQVLSVSTNTLYKYLEQGKIHAARGSAVQGRFRIPESSLEEFLGVTLSPPAPAAKAEKINLSSPAAPTPPTQLPLKLARFLLVLALLALLADLFLTRSPSLPATVTRLFFLGIMLLLAYQEGGYHRRRSLL